MQPENAQVGMSWQQGLCSTACVTCVPHGDAEKESDAAHTPFLIAATVLMV